MIVSQITPFWCFSTQLHITCIRAQRSGVELNDSLDQCFGAMRQDSRNTLDADGQVLVFTDETNRAWEVREIRDPVLPERRKFLLGNDYARGWLLFMSEEERRRLAPFPPGWRYANAAQLRCWVNDALPVRWAGLRAQGPVHDLPPVTASPRDPV